MHIDETIMKSTLIYKCEVWQFKKKKKMDNKLLQLKIFPDNLQENQNQKNYEMKKYGTLCTTKNCTRRYPEKTTGLFYGCVIRIRNKRLKM